MDISLQHSWSVGANMSGIHLQGWHGNYWFYKSIKKVPSPAPRMYIYSCISVGTCGQWCHPPGTFDQLRHNHSWSYKETKRDYRRSSWLERERFSTNTKHGCHKTTSCMSTYLSCYSLTTCSWLCHSLKWFLFGKFVSDWCCDLAMEIYWRNLHEYVCTIVSN